MTRVAVWLGLATAALAAGCLHATADVRHGAPQCEPPFAVGFRVVRAGNLTVGVWYPTSSGERDFKYAANVRGRALKDGPRDRCVRFPLVLFSHGFSGCGIQTVYFTEELARRGYIVAAPDHKDALCSVTGQGSLRAIKTDESFFKPDRWTEQSHADRRDNLRTLIGWMLRSSDFADAIAEDRIGAVGHSLGGYDVLGLVGGWSSWKDDRIRAALLLSPYATPFIVRSRLSAIRVPLMYQGAQGDWGITPSLRGDRGAFALSNSPKYYVELKGGNHFEWTNLACGSEAVGRCLQRKPNPQLVDRYGIAFLDRYLKDDSGALSGLDGKGLAAYLKN